MAMKSKTMPYEKPKGPKTGSMTKKGGKMGGKMMKGK